MSDVIQRLEPATANPDERVPRRNQRNRQGADIAVTTDPWADLYAHPPIVSPSASVDRTPLPGSDPWEPFFRSPALPNPNPDTSVGDETAGPGLSM